MTAIEQAAGESQATTSTEQASGASVFWALACIVLNAMSQSSFCGSFWHGDDTESPLWLYRSSPTICLLDAAAEIWIMIDKYRRSTPRSYQNRAAKPTDISIRLAIFIFAVMPQAIKLFSMKGIWITQVFAGMFLVSSLTSIARSLCLAEPQEDLTRLVKHLQADEVSSFHLTRAVVMLGWLPHVALMYGTCVLVSFRLRTPIDEYIVTVAIWVAAVYQIILTRHGFQQASFTSAGALCPKILLLVLDNIISTGPFGVLVLISNRKVPYKASAFLFAYVFLFHIMLGSFLITALLDTFAKTLIRWFLWLPTPSESDAHHASRTEELELTPVGEALSDDAQGGHGESSMYALPNTSQGTLEAGHGSPPHPQRTGGLGDSTPTPTQSPTISDQWLLTLANTESVDITDAFTPTSRDISTLVHRSNNTDAWPDRALESSHITKSSRDLPPQPKTGDIMRLYVWVLLSPGLMYFVPFFTLYVFSLPAFSSFCDDEEVSYLLAFLLSPHQKKEHATAQEAAERDDADNLAKSHEPIDMIFNDIIWYTCRWVEAKIKRQSKTYLILVLTISNFAIAMIYYLIYFDGAETFTPSWTQIFG